MKQIRNRVSQVSGDTLVNVIIPSSPFIGQEAMVPVSAIGGGGESGQWNPTITNTGGTNPTVNVISGNYSRVGNVVTCSLFLDVIMGVAETIGIFDLDLPIASDFAQEKNAFGIISYNSIGDGEFVSWGIAADVATNKITMNMTSTTAEFNFQYIYAILQYVIL